MKVNIGDISTARSFNMRAGRASGPVDLPVFSD